MRLTLKLVDSVRQVVPPNVGGLRSINRRLEKYKETGYSTRKRTLFLLDFFELGHLYFTAFGLELRCLFLGLERTNI